MSWCQCQRCWNSYSSGSSMSRCPWLSSFCLLLLLLLFLLLLGAAAFSLLERPVEEQLRREVLDLHHSFLQENPCVNQVELNKLLRCTLVARRGNGAQPHGFISSLYLVVATLSTMGSDSYTPKSSQAKLFFILYCAVGIPLTLFVLSVLSSLLLPVLTQGPLHLLQARWGLSRPQATVLHAAVLSVLVLCLLFLLPALLLRAVEPDWSTLDALFFCFVTLSTIGQGVDSLGGSWGPGARKTLELITTCYLLVGLVVIITLKDTVLQVPQVKALMRILSGTRCVELQGIHLSDLVQTEDSIDEEYSQYSHYSQSICTISSAPLELQSPSSGPHTAGPSSPGSR